VKKTFINPDGQTVTIEQEGNLWEVTPKLGRIKAFLSYGMAITLLTKWGFKPLVEGKPSFVERSCKIQVQTVSYKRIS